MSYAQRVTLPVLTASDGSATVYSESIPYGLIDTIVYDKIDFDNGSTMTLTGETTATPIWAESNVNADAVRAPRQATHSTAGVAATFDGTRAVLAPIPIVNERLKLVVASGGNAKTATVHVILR